MSPSDVADQSRVARCIKKEEQAAGTKGNSSAVRLACWRCSDMYSARVTHELQTHVPSKHTDGDGAKTCQQPSRFLPPCVSSYVDLLHMPMQPLHLRLAPVHLCLSSALSLQALHVRLRLTFSHLACSPAPRLQCRISPLFVLSGAEPHLPHHTWSTVESNF